MKIERLDHDKIKIFLTFDDLSERGIHKDDIWREVPTVHELFTEMMDQAYHELGFDTSGPLAVEIFLLPAQGIVVIMTRGKTGADSASDMMDYEHDEMFDMEVTLEESDLISYAFRDFEHLVSAVKLASRYVPGGGSVYRYRDKYYLQIEPQEMNETTWQSLIAVLSEYGDASSVTPAVLQVYGKEIMSGNAIQTICHHF